MSCTYRFDPREYEREHEESPAITEPWDCPHATDGNSEYCLFHRQPSKTDSEAVASALIEKVTEQESAVRLIGANLGTIDLGFAVLRANHNQPIDLRHADIDALSVTDAAIHQPLLLDGASATELDFSNTTFTEELRCRGVKVSDTAAFQSVSFDQKVFFDGAWLNSATFVDATFDDTTTFENATLNNANFSTTWFRGVTFSEAEIGEVQFSNATLDRADFTEAAFVEKASFRRAAFGTVDFGWASFHDTADFSQTRYEHGTDFPGVEFTDVTFSSSDFNGETSFEGVTGETVNWSKTVFARELTVTDANIEEARFKDARLSDCRFEDTTCETLIFGDATIDDVRLKNGVFGDVHFTQSTVENLNCTGSSFETLTLQQARIADFDFEEATAKTASFTRAEVDDCTFSGGTVTDEIQFENALIREGDFTNTTVGSGTFTGTTFERRAVFDNFVADNEVDFTETTVDAPLKMTGATVGCLSLVSATINGQSDFTGTRVDEQATFDETEFEGRAVFTDCSVGSDGSFEQVRFEGRAAFDSMTVGGDANFTGTMFLRRAVFDEMSVGSHATFQDARFDTAVSFTNTHFGRSPTFDGANITSGEFDGPTVETDPPVISLQNCELHDGHLGQPTGEERVIFDCEGATLGTVEVTAEHGEEPALEYVRLVRTDFEDFDFGQYKAAFASLGWELHSTVDSRDDTETDATLEDTYRKAKNGAKDTSDRKAVSELFMKELQYRGRKHGAMMRSSEKPLRTRVLAANNWLGNYLFYWTCGYGERLRRIFTASATVIVIWALVYTFLPRTAKQTSGLTIEGLDSTLALLTPDGMFIFAKNLYFSLVTFTTLGYGDVQPVGTVSRVLAGTEAFIGAILIALVVFVLGRRISI